MGRLASRVSHINTVYIVSFIKLITISAKPQLIIYIQNNKKLLFGSFLVEIKY